MEAEVFKKICVEGAFTQRTQNSGWLFGITQSQRDIIVKNLAEPQLPLAKTWTQICKESRQS